MSTSPATISKAYVRHYRDNGQTIAGVEWSDGSHTSGAVQRKGRLLILGAHMQALFDRAKRDGLTIPVERW